MRDIIQATICFALLLCVCAYGQARTVAGGGVPSGEATTLLSYDAEDPDPTYDVTGSGATEEDCTFNGNGDWCDDYTTAHGGSHSLAFRGDTDNYQGLALSTTSSDFTIEGWIRSNASDDVYLPQMFYDAGTNYWFAMRWDNSGSNWEFVFNGGSGWVDTGSSDFAINTWYHYKISVIGEVGTNDAQVTFWIGTAADLGAADYTGSSLDEGTYDSASYVLFTGGGDDYIVAHDDFTATEN